MKLGKEQVGIGRIDEDVKETRVMGRKVWVKSNQNAIYIYISNSNHVSKSINTF